MKWRGVSKIDRTNWIDEEPMIHHRERRDKANERGEVNLVCESACIGRMMVRCKTEFQQSSSTRITNDIWALGMRFM